MNAPHDIARRMFGLIEPVALVAFFSEEPNDEIVMQRVQDHSVVFGSLGIRASWKPH